MSSVLGSASRVSATEKYQLNLLYSVFVVSEMKHVTSNTTNEQENDWNQSYINLRKFGWIFGIREF